MARRNYNNKDNKSGGKDSKSGNREGKTANVYKGKPSSNVAASGIQAITSGNISYGHPLGVPFNDLFLSKGLLGSSTCDIPGIAAYFVSPSIGVSDGQNETKANLAAHRLFTSFIYANGRNPQYDVPDALIIPLAVGQAAAFYTFAVRAYNVLNSFPSQNRYVPRTLFTSMGLDYDDCKDKLANFAFWLDNYQKKLASLFVTNNLPIIEEWISAFKDIYVDEVDNPKAQMYFFAPEFFYEYQPVRYSTGGCLYPKYWRNYGGSPAQIVPKTFAQLVAFGNDLVDVLINDSDCNRIMADIMLSYGVQSVKDLLPVSLGEPVNVVYDPVVAATIHNSTPLTGLVAATTTIDGQASQDTQVIYQVNNEIIHRPVFSGNKSRMPGLIGGRIFDSPVSAVDPIGNITMARMMVQVPNNKLSSAAWAANGGYYYPAGSSTGTIVPRSTGVYYISFIDSYRVGSSGTIASAGSPYATIEWTSFRTDILTGVEKFHLHPLYYVVEAQNPVTGIVDQNEYGLAMVYGDIHYFTLLEPDDLGKMHETYMLAMLSAGSAD